MHFFTRYNLSTAINFTWLICYRNPFYCYTTQNFILLYFQKLIIIGEKK